MKPKLEKNITISEQQLEDFGAWLFSEGWSKGRIQTNDNDAYGIKSRDNAVAKKIKELLKRN